MASGSFNPSPSDAEQNTLANTIFIDNPIAAYMEQTDSHPGAGSSINGDRGGDCTPTCASPPTEAPLVADPSTSTNLLSPDGEDIYDHLRLNRVMELDPVLRGVTATCGILGVAAGAPTGNEEVDGAFVTELQSHLAALVEDEHQQYRVGRDIARIGLGETPLYQGLDTVVSGISKIVDRSTQMVAHLMNDLAHLDDYDIVLPCTLNIDLQLPSTKLGEAKLSLSETVMELIHHGERWGSLLRAIKLCQSILLKHGRFDVEYRLNPDQKYDSELPTDVVRALGGLEEAFEALRK